MRVARPVRRAGRRNPPIERRQGAPVRPYTYIPVKGGFLYLVAIMDRASRRVLAWRLSNTMDTSFCLAALAEAPRCLTEKSTRNESRCLSRVSTQSRWR